MSLPYFTHGYCLEVYKLFLLCAEVSLASYMIRFIILAKSFYTYFLLSSEYSILLSIFWFYFWDISVFVFIMEALCFPICSFTLSSPLLIPWLVYEYFSFLLFSKNFWGSICFKKLPSSKGFPALFGNILIQFWKLLIFNSNCITSTPAICKILEIRLDILVKAMCVCCSAEGDICSYH